ncbi:hypothetical protein D3C73_1178210 [compost metagenome]
MGRRSFPQQSSLGSIRWGRNVRGSHLPVRFLGTRKAYTDEAGAPWSYIEPAASLSYSRFANFESAVAGYHALLAGRIVDRPQPGNPTDGAAVHRTGLNRYSAAQQANQPD